MIQGSERRRWRYRLGWAAVAQLASSTTNFALYIGLLAWADTVDFGRWVAVLAVYHLVVALARSLVSEPMVAAAGGEGTAVAPTGDGGDPDRAFTWWWGQRRLAVGGVVAGFGAAAIGWRVGADRSTVAAVAIAMPFLVRQDGLRSLAWALQRPSRSVALDGVWMLVTGGLLLVAHVAGVWSAEAIVMAWLVGGLASALVGGPLVEASLGPRPPGSIRSFIGSPGHRTRSAGDPVQVRRPGPAPDPDPGPGPGLGGDLGPRLHARRRSQALLTGSRNLLPVVVATAFGPAPAGLLKAALLPYTPILSLVGGLRVVVLPALQRAAEIDRIPLDRLVVRLLSGYVMLGGGAALATMVVTATASRWLDADQHPTVDLLPWGAAITVIIIVSTILADGIGFGRRPAPVVAWRLVEIGLEWGAVLAVVAVAGPDRVVVGWAIGVALGGLVWLGLGITRPQTANVSSGDVIRRSGLSTNLVEHRGPDRSEV